MFKINEVGKHEKCYNSLIFKMQIKKNPLFKKIRANLVEDAAYMGSLHLVPTLGTGIVSAGRPAVSPGHER